MTIPTWNALRHKAVDRGFSFIELLAYIVIAALLILAAIPQFGLYRDKAKLSVLRDDVHNAALAAEAATIGVVAKGHKADDGVHLVSAHIRTVAASAIITAVTSAVAGTKASDKATSFTVIDAGSGEYDIVGTNTAIDYSVAYASAPDASRGYYAGLNIIRPSGTVTPTNPTPTATPTPTSTPSASSSATPTPSPTATLDPAPTATPKPSASTPPTVWTPIKASAYVNGGDAKLIIQLTGQTLATWGATSATVKADGATTTVSAFPATLAAQNVAIGGSESVTISLAASDGQTVTTTVTATRPTAPTVKAAAITPNRTYLQVTLTSLMSDWAGSGNTVTWGLYWGKTPQDAQLGNGGHVVDTAGKTISEYYLAPAVANAKYYQLVAVVNGKANLIGAPALSGY
ncbi:hypothetical protein GCM10025867_50320 (plasmid) [Frondihabitans sucicola]|uniref:Prepilin-type N-terminal cleavage/methylation domain-containing protein n=1 Tax=Frondihabitans sucicola TaxID=1268041 RepID=A0ABM8GWE4_9MICO|nr:hypothetical protein [Frondihabitans sucicola]BDZ52791.1 hypothetical protein GCM10025867_50320 [Frondihabitans sucicola]